MISKRIFIASFLVSQLIVFNALGQVRLNYDGGTKELGFLMGSLLRDQKEAEIRDFVWTHWKSRSKGRIEASHPHIDCWPAITEFRIDNDIENNWFVEVVVYHREGFFGFSKKELERVRSFEVSRVEVISYEGASEIPTPIAADVVRDSSKFRVRLRTIRPSDDFIF